MHPCPVPDRSEVFSHERRWETCVRCPLSLVATKKVFYKTSNGAEPGRGSHPLLFVAEAPAFSEDVTGRPLEGPAGEVFDDVVYALKVLANRSSTALPEFAVCNVVACLSAEWTDGSVGLPQLKIRPPKKTECEACRPRLQDFLRIVSPRWVVCLGTVSRIHVPLALSGLGLIPAPLTIAVAHPGSIFHKADPEQERPYYVTATASIIGATIYQ